MVAPYVRAYRQLRDRVEPAHVVWGLLFVMAVVPLNGGAAPGAVDACLGAVVLLVLIGARRWESERFIDPLTGCANSRGMAWWLRRCKYPLAVFYADLDGLHAINANEGHAAGNQALHDASWALRRACRRTDLVVRLGTAADEFLVLAEVSHVEAGERIRRRISQECEASGVRLSVGWAFCTKPAEWDWAVSEAEKRMRWQKRIRGSERVAALR
jgi:diguanylate cyclase (GGDEF)-like protein